ncbi:MAG: hypothetical protein AABP62_01695 [Planctomycetota bacterium]
MDAQEKVVDVENQAADESNPQQTNVSKWLARVRVEAGNGSDPHRRWLDIGTEVYLRKTLVLAAGDDIDKKGLKNPYRLAATDVFVEKAQKLLTERGSFYLRWGGVTGFFAVVGMMGLAWFIYHLPLSALLGDLDLNGHSLTFVMFKSSTAGALALGAMFFLTSLSTAFLHEGVALFHRRHSLRFGRLYVYLTEGKVDFKQMEEAFKWNADFATAFKNIRTDRVTASMARRLMEMSMKSVETVLDQMAAESKEKTEHEEDKEKSVQQASESRPTD